MSKIVTPLLLALALAACASHAPQSSCPVTAEAPAACDTDSDCAAKFGGDGGPEPAQ